MKQRSSFKLAGMTVLGLACVSTQAALAQSDPLLGTWQLNVAKSQFNPGPPPRSETLNIQAEGRGQNVKVTLTAIGRQNGNPSNIVFTLFLDGIAHPLTGNPNFDSTADTRVDAYTIIRSYTKSGKLVETQADTVSRDGKTLTVTSTGINGGRPIANIAVFDKQ